MPLTHLLLSVACVTAGLVTIALANDRATRAAHAVITLAMVAMLLAPAPVALAAGVLGAVAIVLAHRERSRCAVDAAGCALLMGLAVVTASLRPAPSHDMPGMPGMAMSAPGADIALRPLVVVAVVAVLVTWHLLRRRTSPTGRRAGSAAAWVMMLAMGAMTALA